MKRFSTTPFGQRPVSVCQRQAQARASQPPALPHVNKYEILRLLSVARREFGITDRDLAVLAALASFSKGAELRSDMNLIVFPSNKTLAERAHGMPESTLRRHLAALVKAGLVLRHDSPNGKRFAARGRVFGFDLSPMIVRAQEIALAAEQVRIAEAELHSKREEAVLALRDAGKLIAYGVSAEVVANWDALSDNVKLAKRMLRRKLDQSQMNDVVDQAHQILSEVNALLPAEKAADVSGKDSQNERHQYNKTKETYESVGIEDLALSEVLEVCPQICAYGDGTIQHWHQLIAAAAFVRAMMGIGADVWEHAVRAMGAGTAAVVVSAMLERFEAIENPGGYLRVLARKAEADDFSVVPMIVALQASGEKAVA